jgi:peptidyl-prolyl cis-trans isomerase C
MNKRFDSWMSLGVLTCAAVLLAGCGKSNVPAAGAKASESQTLAVVNGKPVTTSLFDLYLDAIQRQSGRPVPPEQRAELLDQFVNMQLAADAAEKAGVANQPKTKDQLALARLNVLVDAHLQKYLEDHPVKDEELKPEYDERVASMPKEYKARHVLVEDKATADGVIKDLNAGGDFAKIAQQKSTDKGSAPGGGDLGWFGLETMVKPFSDALAKLEKGKFTQEPVQSQFGWHVILLEDTRSGQAPAFDEVKEQVRTLVQRKHLQTYLTELRKNGKVEMKNPPPPPAPAAESAAETAPAPAPAS